MKSNPSLADVHRALEQFFEPCLELEWKDGPTGDRRYKFKRVSQYREWKQFCQEAGIAEFHLTDETIDRFCEVASQHGFSVATMESPFNLHPK